MLVQVRFRLRGAATAAAATKVAAGWGQQGCQLEAARCRQQLHHMFVPKQFTVCPHLPAQWAAEGHHEPLALGGPDSQRLWEAVAAAPPSGQRQWSLPECGVTGDRLQACSRCRVAFYW